MVWPTEEEMLGRSECTSVAPIEDWHAYFEFDDLEWRQVDSLSDDQTSGPEYVFGDDVLVEVVLDGEPVRAVGPADVVASARDELRRGADVVITVEEPSKVADSRLRLGLAWSLRPDGSFVSLGVCSQPAVRMWADALVEEGVSASPAEVIRAVTVGDDPAGFIDAHLDQFPSTEEAREAGANARKRATPEPPRVTYDHVWDEGDLAEGLVQPVEVEVAVPDVLLGGEQVLCTKTPNGWSPCILLDAAYLADGHQHMVVFVEPGQPVEFVIADERAMYWAADGERSTVATLDAATAASLVERAADVGGRHVELLVPAAKDGGPDVAAGSVAVREEPVRDRQVPAERLPSSTRPQSSASSVTSILSEE